MAEFLSLKDITQWEIYLFNYQLSNYIINFRACVGVVIVYIWKQILSRYMNELLPSYVVGNLELNNQRGTMKTDIYNVLSQ